MAHAASLLLFAWAGQSGGENQPDLITNFWETASLLRQPGFDDQLARFRAIIQSTQQPMNCSNVCRFIGYVGGAAANLKRLAFTLLGAAMKGQALVGRYPPGVTSRLSTNVALRKRCHMSGRFGNECYLQPVSSCRIVTDEPNSTRPEKDFSYPSCTAVNENRLQLLFDQ
ncbi:MAG: hypothetical protein SGPRY_011303, partial [Prymnesium sp.]